MGKLILAGCWGGAFGFAVFQFALAQNWGMVSLTIGLFAAIFYLVSWMIDIR